MGMDEFNKNLEEYKEKLSVYSFAMFRYKTAWCPKITQKHDWAQWIYAHRLQDFRRPPDVYVYEPEDWWVIVHKDCSWESWKEGINWKYSHTTFERLYHPNKFKLVPCEKKVWARDDMWAFYHKPEEKLIVEQETLDFYDPLEQEYEEEDQEQEDEYDDNRSEERSNSNDNDNNKNLQEIIDEDNSPKHDDKLSHQSNNIEYDRVSEENAWTKEEFSLEAAFQKNHSQAPEKDRLDKINLDEEQSILAKPHTTGNTSNTPLSAEDNEDHELSKKEEQTSSEIFNIAMGNAQQIETSKIVEIITSKASSRNESKFFSEYKSESDKDINEIHDVIDDILITDFSKILLESEDRNHSKVAIHNNYNYYINK